MGLLLCTKGAEEAYYYEKLDIKLYSLQELAYVLYKYPVFITENTFDRQLVDWIEKDGSLDILTSRLREMYRSGAELTDMAVEILRESNYYKMSEIRSFQNTLAEILRLNKMARYELIGDTYLRLNRYGKALSFYKKAIAERSNLKILEKLADSYVLLMKFGKAYEIYQGIHKRNLSVLRKLYFLEKIDSEYKAPDEIYNLSSDIVKKWDMEYHKAFEEAKNSESLKNIDDIFEDGDNCLDNAREIIDQWKKEYREKV